MDWYPKAISKKGLEGLAKYKYSAIDLVRFNFEKSPISFYVLRPYWTWAAELFPIWMAPNLITTLGFFFVLGNMLLMLLYSPDLETVAPSWVYFSYALGLWLYSTFDNVDGKQARKTGTSSPLGELFDHGVDALNCTTGGLIQCAGVLSGHSNWSFTILGVATIAFFFSTWETYFTGTMFLGTINGPTEGLLLSIITLLISGIYGPTVWKLNIVPHFIPNSFLNQVVPLSWKPLFSSMTIGQAAIYGIILMLFTIQVPPSMYRAFKACSEKNEGHSAAFYSAFEFLVLVCFATCWILAPGSSLTSNHVVVYSLSWGIAVGKINALIILHHVTHQKYPSYYSLLVPFGLGAALSWIRVLLDHPTFFDTKSEAVYVWAMFSFLVVDYTLWAMKVIEQICDHLKIKCFVIPYRKKGEDFGELVDLSNQTKTTPKKSKNLKKSNDSESPFTTPLKRITENNVTPRRSSRRIASAISLKNDV